MNDDELDRSIRSGLEALIDQARPAAPFPPDAAAGSDPPPDEPDQQGPGTHRARHLSIAAALVLVVIGLGVWLTRDDGSDIDVVDSPPEDPVGFEGWEPGWHELDPGPVPAMDAAHLAWTGERLIVSGLVHPSDEALVPGAFSYDPATGAWTELPTPPRQMNRIVATDDTLVVVGFDDQYPQAPVREWATLGPGAEDWTSHGEVPESAALAVAGSGGGRGQLVWTGERVIDVELGAVLDPATGNATELAMPDDVFAYIQLITATPVWTGEQVVLSSWSPLPGLAWNATGTEWQEVPGLAGDDWPLSTGSAAPAAAVGSEVVLVSEGAEDVDFSAAFSPETGEWTRLADIPNPTRVTPCPYRLTAVGATSVVQPCTEDEVPLRLVGGTWSEIGAPFADGCCTSAVLGTDEALIVWSTSAYTGNPRAPYVEAAVWIPPSDSDSDDPSDTARGPASDLDAPETTSPPTTAAAARDLRSGDASLLDPGPLSPRGGHSVVWSGSEVIVWGGWGDENGSVKHADGAAYALTTGQWRSIAAGPLDPRGNHAAAWTGSEMIIVGGDGRTDSAAYDPVADSWRQLPPAPFPIAVDPYLDDEGRAVTDSALHIWNVTQDQVARYDFAAEQWDQSPGPGFDNVTIGSLQIVGSDIVALGTTSSFGSPLHVAVTDSSAGAWRRLPDGATDQYGNSLNPRSSVGLDDVLIAWQAGPVEPEAAVALNPDTGEWQSRSPHVLPGCEGSWVPQRIDDGLLTSSCAVTARYQASQDAWRQVDIGELTVSGRDSVWTGSEIVSWGSTCCYGTGGSPFQPNVAWSYAPPP